MKCRDLIWHRHRNVHESPVLHFILAVEETI